MPVMDESERLSSLIAEIYDAALEPATWPRVLERSASFVHGTASALFMKDFVRKTHNALYTWGYDPEFIRRYPEKYVPLDPFTTGQLFFEIDQPISLSNIIPHAEFRETQFYKEMIRPRRWIDAIGVTLERSVTTYVAFSVIRSEHEGVADTEALRRIGLIAPHVRRAVVISKVIDLHKVEAAALMDTLDGLAAAMFLVDTSGHIVHANAAGGAMLSGSNVLHAVADKLVAIDPRADRALQDVFKAADAGDAEVGSKGIAVTLGEDNGERWLAHVLPLTCGARRKASTSYSAVAAVFVRKAAFHVPHPLETLVNLYRLTPTEMRVVMAIVEIGGVPEVAPVLGISETTVKTHLQRIFAKTGTKRQADLVKLVAGHIGPLA